MELPHFSVRVPPIRMDSNKENKINHNKPFKSLFSFWDMRELEQRKKLVDYLKRNLKKGYTMDALRWALINQDYSKSLIERAIEQTNKELAEAAPVIKEKPKITHHVIDEYDQPIKIRKSWWSKVFG
jgi:hypothetical protein